MVKNKMLIGIEYGRNDRACFLREIYFDFFGARRNTEDDAEGQKTAEDFAHKRSINKY